jgi:hypothetical protein
MSPDRDHGLKYLGSEDATTCHLITLSHSTSKMVAVSHLDRVCKGALDKLVTQLIMSGQDHPDTVQDSREAADDVTISIFGGYEDENDTSEELSLDLIRYLIKSHFRYLNKSNFLCQFS